MVFRQVMVAVAVVATATGFASGCRRTGKNLKEMCRRLDKCSDEVVNAYAARHGIPMANIPKAMRAKLKEGLQEKKCLEQNKGKALKKKYEKCLRKADCKSFAECFVTIEEGAAGAGPGKAASTLQSGAVQSGSQQPDKGASGKE